ncbi:MAG TPA: hypothetical protein VKZ87_13645 [Ferrovibrio sp.]|uniref:hypothetical protein n=1 Tax=Ferrovibrio sp. TaxID=1917215 RepID=UPI002B4AF616|nr:hypothetical protein [Ferrovibrio sp.]HLT78422.1 hypothetical protein [Ferrovibrio sp.]
MSEFDIAWAAIVARGLSAACFVGGVIWLMERTSPFIGGIVLALPIVTAPAYLFLVLLHPPGFVADAALASIATIGAVLLFLVTVIALVRHLSMPLTLLCALTVWSLTGLLVRAVPPGVLSSLAILGAAGLVAWLSGRRVPLTAPAARGRSPLYEIVLRGAAAGLLVIGVTVLAETMGPRVAGIFSSFPVALLTVCWFMPRRLDHTGIRAALRATQIGMVSHLPFFLCLVLLGPRTGGSRPGDFTAFGVGILGSLAVALALALIRRYQLRKG